MTELWINYRDESGESGRVRMDGERFTVGRHSACDLVIPNSKLSREHLIIERSDDRFYAEDNGSSNGTDLNGSPLLDRVEIMSGDRADLGGGVEIDFEILADEAQTSQTALAKAPDGLAVAETAIAADIPPPTIVPSQPNGGFPIGILVIGPLAVILLLAVGIGLVMVLGGGGRVSSTGDVDRTSRERRHSDDDVDDDDDKDPDKTPVSASPEATSTPSTTGSPQSSPSNVGQNAKVEQNAAAFVRRIAQNDPNAFLTAEQALKVAGRVKQLSGSSALGANIDSARKNAVQIRSIAAAKNLKPQFLATAALAKLGSTRGDVLQTAQSMADVFEKLNTQIGSERSDDCLLMIAAYDQGQRGDFMGLRNTLQDLANKFPESSRSIRTIWFLQKQGKITPAEFDFALQFLAVGTISQNPKDFGLSVEPLSL